MLGGERDSTIITYLTYFINACRPEDVQIFLVKTGLSGHTVKTGETVEIVVTKETEETIQL